MAYHYYNPTNSSRESLSEGSKNLLSTLGMSHSWDDNNGPNQLSFRNVASAVRYARNRAHKRLYTSGDVGQENSQSADLNHYQILSDQWSKRIGYHKGRVENIFDGAIPQKIGTNKVVLGDHTFDINNPVNSLTEFLLKFRHRIFFSYSPAEVETMVIKLRAIISDVMLEYDRLDRKYGRREDGTTRFSHAWETMIIRISYGNFTLEDIFSCLLHDYMEDVEEEDNTKESALRNNLGDFDPKFDFADSVIDTVKKMTKHPLEYYLSSHYKNSAKIRFLGRSEAKKQYLQEKVKEQKKHLQSLRTDDYYGHMDSYRHTEFLNKCADREHALTNFHDGASIEKVWRKIQETQKYFLPELQRRKELTTGSKWHKIFITVESRMFLALRQLERRFPFQRGAKEK